MRCKPWVGCPRGCANEPIEFHTRPQPTRLKHTRNDERVCSVTWYGFVVLFCLVWPPTRASKGCTRLSLQKPQKHGPPRYHTCLVASLVSRIRAFRLSPILCLFRGSQKTMHGSLRGCFMFSSGSREVPESQTTDSFVCRMGSWAVNKYRMLAVRKRLTDNSPPSSAMLRALAVLVRLSANPNPPRCRPSYPPHEGCCLLDGPTTPVKADTILTPAPGVRFKAG